MQHRKHVRRVRFTMVALAAVVIVTVTLVTACASTSYYLPRPDSPDDTLLVIASDKIANPLVEYRVVLESGLRIRVFPMYSLSFVRGLPPGRHRAVRLDSGMPGKTGAIDSVEIDIPFTVTAGEITVFPMRLDVTWEKNRPSPLYEVATQVCRGLQITNRDMVLIGERFERYSRADAWSAHTFAPLERPESTAGIEIVSRKTFLSTDTSGSTCFPAGTPVATPTGARRIETLAAGDSVYALDLSTGTWEVRPVSRLLVHEHNGVLLRISVGDSTVSATPEHPFWKVDRAARDGGSWVLASELNPGDPLLLRNGGEAVVSGVVSTTNSLPVYNIEVYDLHNYAVGSRGILVHNKGGAEAP